MPSKLAEPRSIAAQLVLLFTLAVALLLCAGVGILYVIVVQHAHEEDNEVLADKVSALRADLHNSAAVEALRTGLGVSRESTRIGYWVRALDPAGAVVVQTPEMDALLPRDAFPAPAT